jgi:dTDP-4-dehydrorhamnose 3,5-epimerase
VDTLMQIRQTGISGVCVVDTAMRADHRGAFGRLFCEEALAPVLDGRRIVQINSSRTTALGAIRGMHYQLPPHAEMKLVRCLRGRVYDVALDLREDSPTFLHWHAEELSADNASMLVIPEGCAHGFQVLEPESELLYLHTTAYAPDAERGIMYSDPAAAIRWPLAVTDISRRDLSHPLMAADSKGIAL